MRFGIDLGGTKIEIRALGEHGKELLCKRVPTPTQCYADVVAAIRDLVFDSELQLGRRGSVGVAIPGSMSSMTGLVKNAPNIGLKGHPLDRDLAAALGRPVRIENDANCFTLSEARDGAAAGKNVVFGIIVGTGVGGGICVGGHILTGANHIAGEWGHTPLPAPCGEELTHPVLCKCGRSNCIESWCSGPGLAARFTVRTGRTLSVPEIVAEAKRGDREAAEEMEKFYDRFARAIGTIVSIIDPDVVVIGGGLSNIDALYSELPRRAQKHAISPEGPIRVVKNRHGDSSGVRGAAWLWREEEVEE
ncbi:MAG: ROK family protein [Rhizomicrobium sp.]|jgi:fructokinase